LTKFFVKSGLTFEYMIHRGEIVEEAIKESGISKTLIAKRLNIARNTLNNRLDEMNLDWEFIIEVGRVIREDIINTRFSDKTASTVKQAREKYITTNEDDNTELEKCRDELDKYKTRYINLLEDYNRLLQEKQG